MPDLILSLVRDEPLLTEEIKIIKPDGPHKAVQAVLRRARVLLAVSDGHTQRAAGIVASELQALRKGLEANYRAAKAPYLAAGRALDQLFKDIDEPLKREYDRVTGLVSAYQDQERRKTELAKAKQDADQRAKEEAERKRLAELERQKQDAELKARHAEDARERLDNKRVVNQLEGAIEEQKVVLALQQEEFPMTRAEETPKVVGGRVYTDYDIEEIDIHAFAAAHPELVEIKLKRGATKEAIRLLDEAGKPLVMAGLRIRKYTRASFVGAAQIRMAKGE
jgi:hypothetical protein